MMRDGFRLAAVVALSAWLCGTANAAARNQAAASQAAKTQAKAELKDAKGQTVGHATLTETPHGVLVRVNLEKAATGEHAFHIHDVGSCEPPDFKSAGGHFNPAGAKHGFLAAQGPHAGDLPNIHVPAAGQLTFEFLAAGATLEKGPKSLLDSNGSALVMHAKADDYRTDPAGAAGDRIACGVVSQ